MSTPYVPADVDLEEGPSPEPKPVRHPDSDPDPDQILNPRPRPHRLGAARARFAAGAVDWARLHRLAADTAFALLLIAILLLAGWLTARHDHYWDWTSSARNSLSSESRALLDGLIEPLRITVYAPAEHRVARAAEQLLARYRKHRDDLLIEYVDPQRFPERARGADVQLLGQMVLDYRGRRETLFVLSESSLSNAIARLSQPVSPLVAVLEGHGERAIGGAAGSDLGRFAQLLHQRGFRLQPIDLARAPAIPDNTDLLLLSTPSIALFPGEAEALVSYIERGGNLLWLMDPGDQPGMRPLALALGVSPLPGQVVDAAAANLGLDTPTIAIVKDWPEHPLGLGMQHPALFAGSLAFEERTAPGWQLAATLATGNESWNETGPVRGEVSRNQGTGEQPGPLPVAMVLTRARPGTEPASDRGATDAAPLDAQQPSGTMPDAQRPADETQNDRIPAGNESDVDGSQDAEQRVIVVGDGDFLSNAHLANGSNQALAMRMARWLTGQEDLVSIQTPPSDSDALVLSPVRGWLIIGGGLIALPLLLVAAGIWLRWHRGRA